MPAQILQTNDAAFATVVPFAPRSDRPVYCSTCFDKVRAASQPVSVTA